MPRRCVGLMLDMLAKARILALRRMIVVFAVGFAILMWQYGHLPNVSASSSRSLIEACDLPVLAIYVINSSRKPDSVHNLTGRFVKTCGCDLGSVVPYLMVADHNDVFTSPLARSLLPNIAKDFTRIRRHLRFAITHLSLWAEINRSAACQGAGSVDEYVLVMDDSEEPNPWFVAGVHEVNRIVRSLPDTLAPDLINLNAGWPRGDPLASLNVSVDVQLLQVSKSLHHPSRLVVNRSNVWLSAYLLRCAGAGALMHEVSSFPLGEGSYDGAHPTFDRQVAEVLSTTSTAVTGFVLSPQNAISTHTTDFVASMGSCKVPVAETYVITEAAGPGYKRFLSHMSSVCGGDIGLIERHERSKAIDETLSSAWTRQILPGMSNSTPSPGARFGISVALTHLTLWEKISRSTACQRKEGLSNYVLVLDDRERPKDVFAAGVDAVLNATRSMPSAMQPDLINLSVRRPSGSKVAALKLLVRARLLAVQKRYRAGSRLAGQRPNVWMSAYLVRCDRAAALMQGASRFPNGNDTYNGFQPLFDTHMMDVFTSTWTNSTAFVVAPESTISFHPYPCQLPVVGTYVISMEHKPELFRDFLGHLSDVCAGSTGQVRNHPGVIATDDIANSSWARKLLPGMSTRIVQRGNLGLSLAHLSMWSRINESAECQAPGAQDKYALVFEDDERPRPVFQAGVMEVLRAVGRLPSGRRPDMINLNVHRARGDQVALLDLPDRTRLLSIQKDLGNLTRFRSLRPNVWMSAYLVRCGGADALLREGGAYPYGSLAFDGQWPIFDQHIADVLSSPNTSVTGFVLTPEHALSTHVEGFDTRKTQNSLQNSLSMSAGSSRDAVVAGFACVAQPSEMVALLVTVTTLIR